MRGATRHTPATSAVLTLQFTHPMRGATAFFYNYLRSVIILLYICDKLFCSYAAYFLGFYREIVFIIFFAGANLPGKE